MLKKSIVLLVTLLFCLGELHAKDFDLEVRSGISYSPDLFGLCIGAFTSFPLAGTVVIQPGIVLHTTGAEYRSYRGIGANIPVYASWRPAINENVKLRINAGPYVGIADNLNVGATAEAGFEFKKFYTGVSYFQNCINDKNSQFNLSFGYKFVL